MALGMRSRLCYKADLLRSLPHIGPLRFNRFALGMTKSGTTPLSLKHLKVEDNYFYSTRHVAPNPGPVPGFFAP